MTDVLTLKALAAMFDVVLALAKEVNRISPLSDDAMRAMQTMTDAMAEAMKGIAE